MASVTLTLPQALDRAISAYNAGKLVEAEKLCQQIISYKQDFFDALSLLAVIQASLGKSDLALANYDRALAVRPDDADALFNRAVTLQALKRLDEALASYDRALAMRPDHGQALNNRGVALQALKRYDEALANYDRALAVRPADAEALNNRGVALQALDRHDEALASYDRALSVQPDHAEALNNRGVTLRKLRRHDEALASFDRALALRPDRADAHYNRANILKELTRLDEALASYDSALAANADHAHALSEAADCAIQLCDWDRRARFAADLDAHVRGEKAVVYPFVLLGYSDDSALQAQCAETFLRDRIPAPPQPLWQGSFFRHDKIRIAYLSANFRNHPVAYLSAELFELHDRRRFEAIGMSFGPDDKSEIRARLVDAFDEFHDIRSAGDKDVAKLLNDLQVDIAVDMTGYTLGTRPGILAHRPAPIQASYLGYPCTMGAPFIDYIIADETVAPFDHQKFYAEKIVHLPDCYQVNDRKRPIAARTPMRREMDLPEHGFVFCCFNNSWKIAPAMFDVWMRLLHRVEGSVLWLLRDNESAERNLRMEAERRGIDPSRLVFAGRLPLDEHLARHRLADLFLDTLPYNAHTTASDALWAGLPVLTCKGGTFAGRVAASLLHAVGLPELIASNLEEYEAMALKIAHDPARLAAIKAKLAGNRDRNPLFDTDRFARHIEAAYTTMWETWQRGEAPKSFSVEPID